jgi:hypothetical protein
VVPQVKIDDKSVQARLHQGAGGTHLWVTNPSREPRQVKIELGSVAGNFKSGEDLWGNQSVALEGQQVTVSVGGRDAAVIALL